MAATGQKQAFVDASECKSFTERTKLSRLLWMLQRAKFS